MENRNYQTNSGYTSGPTYVQVQRETNSIGTAGFVLALLAIFVGWFPIIGWLIWLLGAVLSTVGLFRRPRGLAVAGFIISFIWFFVILLIIFSGLTLAGLSSLFAI